MSEDAEPVRTLPYARTGITGQLTLEAFAALVADLRTEMAALRPVDRDRLLSRQVRPQSFTGRPWIWQAITLAEAAELTGLAKTTLRRYSKPSDREREAQEVTGSNPLLPPPLGALPPRGEAQTPANVWDAGAIALWRASTREGGLGLSRRNPPTEHPKHPGLWSRTLPHRQFAVLAFLRAVIREDTAIDVGPALEELAASGLDTAGVNLRWYYIQARRAEARTFIARLQSECTRSDGLVSLPHVARVYGTRRGTILQALNRGDLELAGYDEHGRKLVDPARLRQQGNKPGGPTTREGVRKGLGRVPVDQDRPNALPLPLRCGNARRDRLAKTLQYVGAHRAVLTGRYPDVDREELFRLTRLGDLQDTLSEGYERFPWLTERGEAFHLGFRIGDQPEVHEVSLSSLPSSRHACATPSAISSPSPQMQSSGSISPHCLQWRN